jgi:hypothetical protein
MPHNPFAKSRPNPKRREPRRVRDREQLHGDAKTGRRDEIFQRSKGRCEACRVCGKPSDAQVHRFWEPPGGHEFARCEVPISPVTMHWSHKRHAARKDDVLAGGIASCLRCHAYSHNAGGKPVPRRPGRLMKKSEAEAYWKGTVCFCERPKKPDTCFEDICRSLLSPKSRYDVEHCTGKDWLIAMADAEKELLAAYAREKESEMPRFQAGDEAV